MDGAEAASELNPLHQDMPPQRTQSRIDPRERALSVRRGNREGGGNRAGMSKTISRRAAKPPTYMTKRRRPGGPSALEWVLLATAGVELVSKLVELVSKLIR